MAIVKEIIVTVDSKQAVKGVEDVDKSIKKTDDSTKDLTGALDKMTGGLITGFKSAVGGVKKGIIAMKSFKVAIAATGIGLLVIAVGSLVTYFTQTQRGADLISKAFAGIGATVSVLIDRISSFGEGLSLIFSGEYDKGAKLLKASVKGIGEEIVKETKSAIALDEALKKLEDREIALIQVNAKRRAEIEKLRLTAEDETKSNKERADALREAANLQNKISDDEISIAKERARISQEQIDLGESTREELRENEEIQARVIELEAERDRGLKRLQTRLNSFIDTTKELNDVTKKETFEEFERRNNEIKKQIEQDKKESERIKEENFKKNQDLQSYLDEQEQIEMDAEDVRLDREYKASQKRIIFEQNVAQAKEDLAINGLNLLANVAKKGSAFAKGVAIAQVVREQVSSVSNIISNTAVANAKAAAASPLTAGQPFVAINTISAGLGIAGGLVGAAKAIKDINSEKKTPTGGNVPSAGGGGAPAPSFNLVQGTQGNQIAQSINQNNQQPLKAYVVSGDVTSQQSLDRNAKVNASL